MLKRNNQAVELLAPAGSPDKMRYALVYGADAVYAGIPDFSMRARINAFTEENLEKAVREAHRLKKKFYVTLNIYAHNHHLAKIKKHLQFLRRIKPDAIILSDPGILSLVKQYYPKAEIHLSTQANATNAEAVKFWANQGIKRIILAREVSLSEIKEIHQSNPGVELECFVHGAMCMSYSGRCILSKWMTGRSANLGDCVQACRWRYRGAHSAKRRTLAMTVEDEKGEFEIDLEEDEKGTYFFNSKDLNLLAHLDELKKAGVTSFKIEGRNKSVFYLAVATRAYRKVIDQIQVKGSKSKARKVIQAQQRELNSLVHRGYTTGFLLGKEPEHNFDDSHVATRRQFVGEVLENKKGLLKIKVHNALRVKDSIEVVTPNRNIPFRINSLYNDKMEKIASAHGGHGKGYFLKTSLKTIKPFSLICKKVKA